MSLSAKRALYCIIFDCGNDWLRGATAFISVWPFAWPFPAKTALYSTVFGAEINGLELRQHSLAIDISFGPLFGFFPQTEIAKRAPFFMVFGCGNKWLRGAEASVNMSRC